MKRKVASALLAPLPKEEKLVSSAKDKRNVGFFSEINAQAKREFAILALKKGVTQRELFREALNDLFEKNDMSRIA